MKRAVPAGTARFFYKQILDSGLFLSDKQKYRGKNPVNNND
jgi:hypothetical protein